MGDRTYTEIRFAGPIPRNVAEELVGDLNSQHCASDNRSHGEIRVEDLVSEPHFYDEQCNYGQMDDVENTCRAHGVPYRKTWEAGGGYGPGMTVFTGDEVHECSTIDGEPAVTRAMLKQLGTGILEFFDRFDFSAPRYPPVTIVDDQQEAA